MIYVLIGENAYMRRQELAKLTAGHEAMTRDGAEIDVSELATVLAGQSLFGGGEMIVLSDVSTNKSLWEALEPWIDRLDDDRTLILCETKPDKRTKTYKKLQKTARLIDCENWQVRQVGQAETWLGRYAKDNGVSINLELVSDMVQRAIRPSTIDEKPIIDQELLVRAIDQLMLADGPVTADMLMTVLPPALHEDVFGLLERAISGDSQMVQQMIHHLAASHEGHQTLGLLSSQACNLAALVLSDETSEQVAADIGAHPYALRQLVPIARKCSRNRITQVVSGLARADEQLKRGRGDVWMLIETALMRIALTK